MSAPLEPRGSSPQDHDGLYRALMEHLPQTSVVAYDRNLRFTVAAGPALGEQGWSPTDLEGRTLEEIVPAEQASHLRVIYEKALHGQQGSIEYRSGRDGRTYWLRTLPIREPDGEVVGGMALSLDITDRTEARRALTEMVQRFSTTFQHAQIGLGVVDMQGRLREANSVMARIVGLQAEEVERSEMHELIHADDRGAYLDAVQRMVSGIEPNVELNLRAKHAAGHAVPCQLNLAIVRRGDGSPSHVVAQIQDLSERNGYEERLRHMAEHDPLTELANRRVLERELGRLVDGTSASGSPGALLWADLDGFKRINDTLGHRTGDQLLVAGAATLRSITAPPDVVVRTGGDEFAILIANAGPDKADQLAKKLVVAIREHTHVWRAAGHAAVTVSVGVALLDDGSSSDEVLIAADLAMYEAKISGGDQSVSYSETVVTRGKSPQRRGHHVDSVERALEADALVLLAQPICDARTEEPVMHELLLRMPGPDGGLIEPSAFLPSAEASGLIRRIDRWVLTSALDMLDAAAEGGEMLRLAVNLSYVSLYDHDLVKLIEGRLAAIGAEPSSLIIELTERSRAGSLEASCRAAARLKRAGCSVALDDFGVGFGSFQYLKHVPADYLKIDGEFVAGMADGGVDLVVVRSAVAAARALGMITIAEHIERAETLDLLRREHVDLVQGYFLGRPAAIGEGRSAANR